MTISYHILSVRGVKEGKYLFKRGMEVTSDIMLSFSCSPETEPAQRAAHWQAPLMAIATPQHYCSSGAFWWLSPQEP